MIGFFVVVFIQDIAEQDCSWCKSWKISERYSKHLRHCHSKPSSPCVRQFHLNCWSQWSRFFRRGSRKDKVENIKGSLTIKDDIDLQLFLKLNLRYSNRIYWTKDFQMAKGFQEHFLNCSMLIYSPSCLFELYRCVWMLLDSLNSPIPPPVSRNPLEWWEGRNLQVQYIAT